MVGGVATRTSPCTTPPPPPPPPPHPPLRCDIVTTPGSGFGPGGEGFVRASAFGHRADIEEAVARFRAAYG